MDFTQAFLKETLQITEQLDNIAIESMADLLVRVRNQKGRVFVLGVGGSAANASHLVNDLRKLADIEAYAPTDNVSELTARINDKSWVSVFVDWLTISRLNPRDMLFVLSVGGGDAEKNISPNLVAALRYGKQVGAIITGIVGRDGGYTAKVADTCVIIPTINSQHITPHAESFQAVIWHLLISHPKLKIHATKWEGLAQVTNEIA